MLKGKVLSVLLVMALVIGLLGIPNTQAAYNLVWSDEFDGSSVNTGKWVFDLGGGGWGNNELQYYRAENATVSGGILTITAKKESYGGYSYTSARMKTKGKFDFKYGKVEARLSVPLGKGLWPAFWMLGANIDSVSWPKCGEIDIMEHINTETKIYGTMHWDNNGYVSYGGNTACSTPSSYHTYMIEWTSSAIKWYYDGVQYLEGNILNSINGTDEFHRNFFMLLNFAVGGNWPGSPDGTTPFPSYYMVDYVRVYQDTASPTPTPTPTPGGATLLSQGKAATASSYQTGNEVYKGNDGNTSTRWAASGATFPQWWRVDLGAGNTLSRVDIAWYNSSSRAYKYKIEVSTDDVNYTTKVDKTGNTTYGDTSDSFAATARYVRITVTGCTYSGAYASAFEFKVYGN